MVPTYLNASLRQHATTIFAEMSELALSTGSINLGQGFPDTDGPEEIKEAAIAAIRGGHNQYPPGPGVPDLRRAVSRHQLERYRLEYQPDHEVLVTTGATEAIAASILSLCRPGDEVLVFEPYYDAYAACIDLAGATRRAIPLRPPEWSFDPAELARSVTPRTRMLVLNSPHNPTGKVFARRELEAIARLCIEHEILVVTDEVYEHLIFEGEHVPIATLPGMRERTVTVSSAGKSFGLTGWKVGWACAPPPLLGAVRAAKQFLTYVSGGPFQHAIARALDGGTRFTDPIRRDLEHQRDVLCDGLASLGLDVYRPAATYFAITDIRSIGHDDGVEFCRALPGRCGVVAIPTVDFYDHPEAGRSLVRWAFCKRPAVLEEALTRLKSLRA